MIPKVHAETEEWFLCAVDAETGAKRWCIVDPMSAGIPPDPQELDVSSGTVFVAGATHLFALDSDTGDERWRVQIQPD